MKRFLVLTLLAALVTAACYDYPVWRMRQAYRKYKSGNFAGAIADWSSLQKFPGRSGAAQFNRGVAACRLGNYSAAINDFRSASSTNDLRLRGKSLYNLGTACLRTPSGQGVAPAAAERHLREAVKSLQDASTLDPTDDAATVNLNVARARLSAMLNGKGQQDKGPLPESRPRQSMAGAGEKKQGDPGEPDKGAAKPGQATDRDQAGAKRRAAMDRNEAMRMLDEARGRESLRSTKPASGEGRGLTPPEKDW